MYSLQAYMYIYQRDYLLLQPNSTRHPTLVIFLITRASSTRWQAWAGRLPWVGRGIRVIPLGFLARAFDVKNSEFLLVGALIHHSFELIESLPDRLAQVFPGFHILQILKHGFCKRLQGHWSAACMGKSQQRGDPEGAQ
eukprot:CAMPEP_0114271852 /NCGR_PEP_ID=MMETSP0058-20121206/28091_1 /TAXON_ID=36894 /ORGANISM="Pyramimonas parkeae, CCMP726" /LENGTH=138 /DNA_ID=CAMNT_0001390881 /DNA_START=91 /DNA_END=507 /DNA_ORIENTATION=+